MKNTSRSYPTVSLFGMSLDPSRDHHAAMTKMKIDAAIYTRPILVDVVGCHLKPMTIVQKLVSVGYCSIQRHSTVECHMKPMTIVQKLVSVGYCSIQRKLYGFRISLDSDRKKHCSSFSIDCFRLTAANMDNIYVFRKRIDVTE